MNGMWSLKGFRLLCHFHWLCYLNKKFDLFRKPCHTFHQNKITNAYELIYHAKKRWNFLVDVNKNGNKTIVVLQFLLLPWNVNETARISWLPWISFKLLTDAWVRTWNFSFLNRYSKNCEMKYFRSPFQSNSAARGLVCVSEIFFCTVRCQSAPNCR